MYEKHAHSIQIRNKRVSFCVLYGVYWNVGQMKLFTDLARKILETVDV